MEVLKVNPIKKEGNTWYIPSEGVPQDMKNKYLNKSVSDGTATVFISGVSFKQGESTVGLEHESKALDNFFNI
jgi:hypothetical protein